MASLVVASFGGCGNSDSSESSSEKSNSSSAAETTAAEKDDAADVGSDADSSAAATELYTVIGEDGHGETYMDGEKTADYSAYAYDNGDKDNGKGIYVAYSNLTGEVSHAEYTIEEKDGKTVLTFTNDDGVISYVKRA